MLRVAEDAVFGTADPNLAVFRLHLGQDANDRDLGIRDLATVSDGFLVLAGPALPEGDDAEGSGVAYHWQEDVEPRKLSDVGLRRRGVKPEGLLVLSEDSGAYRVLVIHDGAPGGAPLDGTSSPGTDTAVVFTPAAAAMRSSISSLDFSPGWAITGRGAAAVQPWQRVRRCCLIDRPTARCRRC